MLKKVIAMICVVVVSISCAACEFAASMATQTLSLTTGDSLVVSFKTDKHNWSMDLKDDLLTLVEKDEIIFKCAFHNDDSMEDYAEIVHEALKNGTQDIEFEEDGQIDNIKYVLVSFEQDDKIVYEIIGWIIGSDTGIVADIYGAKSFAKEIIETLKFKVKKTEQANTDYYNEVIDEIEY